MKYTTSMLMAAGIAAAQSTTVSILMPMVDPQDLVGSVVTVQETFTVYAISCPGNEDAIECGLPSDLTISSGPTTMAYTVELASDT